MPVLTGLGTTAPFADWRSNMLTEATQRFRGPDGYFLPGSVLGFDFMSPYNQAVTVPMIEHSDVLFAWLDHNTVGDLTIYRDALHASSKDRLLIIGVDENYTGPLYGIDTIASLLVRSDSPLRAFGKARRFVIDTLYTSAHPTPPELAFWCAAMENNAPELEDLVPEFEVRFPSLDGRPTVRRFDFAVPSYKLLIEIDGAGHNDDLADKNDRLKTELAERYGYSVMRFRSTPMVSDPESKVAEVIERISRTMPRKDNFLKTRIMPNRAMDGWPFGIVRHEGKPVAHGPEKAESNVGEDIIIGMIPKHFTRDLERIDRQREIMRRVGEKFGKTDAEMDEFFNWVDISHLGDVRTWESARANQRLIINIDLYCQETVATALADESILPHVERVESTVIEVDVSQSWNQQCSANLWAALRHIIPITEAEIEALYQSPEGTMTPPLLTETGPSRIVSFRAGSAFDEDTAWEVANWWDESLDPPMREFTLRVEGGKSSLRGALGVDLYQRFPHLGKVNRWYLGEENGSPMVWSTSYPLVKINFVMGEETDRELAKMLAYPEHYHKK